MPHLLLHPHVSTPVTGVYWVVMQTLLLLMSHGIIKLSHSGKPKNSVPCVHLGLCRNVHVWMSESHARMVNVIHPLFNDTIGLLYLFYFPRLIPLSLFCRGTQAISSSWDAR